MKGLGLGLVLCAMMAAASCTEFPSIEEGGNVPVENSYVLKVKSASMNEVSGDTVVGKTGMTYVFQLYKNGVPILAQFDPGNGSPLTVTKMMTVSYAAGTYKVSATDQATNIEKHLYMKIAGQVTTSNEIVILNAKTVSTDGLSAQATFLFRCDAIFNNVPPVAGILSFESLNISPNIFWKDYVLSDIVTVNNIKYYQYTMNVKKGQEVRFTYRINASSWAYIESVYKNADGTYTFTVNSDWSIGPKAKSLSLPGQAGDSLVRLDTNLSGGLMLYFKKSAFTSVSTTLAYKEGADSAVINLAPATENTAYLVGTIPTKGGEIVFLPKTADVSKTMFWSEADKACKLQLMTIKSLKMK